MPELAHLLVFGLHDGGAIGIGLDDIIGIKTLDHQHHKGQTYKQHDDYHKERGYHLPQRPRAFKEFEEALVAHDVYGYGLLGVVWLSYRVSLWRHALIVIHLFGYFWRHSSNRL